MKKKSLLLTLCLMLLLGMLAACSGKKDDTSKTPSDNNKDPQTSEGPQKGGTITGAMDTAPAGLFNPVFYSDSYEANILAFTHEGLVGQDKTLKFIPSLAKEWTFNEDQTEVTFKLQENVKWHDGEPFTANDVVFTYKTIASPGYVEAGG
ncbi:MAG TPA: ABC transporter substrate-binding protein, partial [Pseudoneobacillus sp.]|nr:ABC transporter substrate-binding protein [Pseudoneobacillus sp.]